MAASSRQIFLSKDANKRARVVGSCGGSPSHQSTTLATLFAMGRQRGSRTRRAFYLIIWPPSAPRALGSSERLELGLRLEAFKAVNSPVQ